MSWYQAVAFCRWLSTKLGYAIQLPTEWEWQQATTGGKPDNVYPWGNEYMSGYSNINEMRSSDEVGPHYLQQTTAVGMCPQGKSLCAPANLPSGR